MPNKLEHELVQLNRMRDAAVAELRVAFQNHGFDVRTCSDDDLSRSLREEALLGTMSEKDLFARAFARLSR